MQFAPDDRDPFWKKIEKIIQTNALNKDKEFVLSGPWKKFVREQDGIKIYQVNGQWMRNNLLASWNHGGHGYVCEFIPIDEVWISDTHPANCACSNVNNNREISKRYFESCALHEITERQLMIEGMEYWQAHQIAMEKEVEAGILKDGNTEDYSP